jgi:hypothetical protein
MSESVTLRESMSVELVRGEKGAQSDSLPLSGKFVLEHWRDGRRINEYHFNNLVTNEAKNRLFNTMFKSTAQFANWFVGLIGTASYTALAAADDYADIGQTANGWREFTTYTDNVNSGNAGTRPAWAAASASAQAITNTSPAIFDITTAGTIKGAFICAGASAQTKGDHTAGGVLWSEGLFTSGDNVAQIGDQLKFTYSVSA